MNKLFTTIEEGRSKRAEGRRRLVGDSDPPLIVDRQTLAGALNPDWARHRGNIQDFRIFPSASCLLPPALSGGQIINVRLITLYQLTTTRLRNQRGGADGRLPSNLKEGFRDWGVGCGVNKPFSFLVVKKFFHEDYLRTSGFLIILSSRLIFPKILNSHFHYDDDNDE